MLLIMGSIFLIFHFIIKFLFFGYPLEKYLIDKFSVTKMLSDNS